MNAKRHLKIFTAVTFVWGAFWLAGLPNYYQQYSTNFMILFDLILLVPVALILYFLLRKEKDYRMKFACWLGFYCTVPFFIYDYLFCGIYLGEGIYFTSKYWYLSVYYIIPWLLCVPMAMWMEQTRFE